MRTVRKLHLIYILFFGFFLLFLFITLFVSVLVKPHKLVARLRLKPEHVVDVSVADILSCKDLLELINELLVLTGFEDLVICVDST